MNKAAQLSKQLEKLDVAEGMQLIEQSNKEALYFDVIGDSMCIMHDDGSVNIIENMGIGCRSMISLQTVDLEFTGLGSNWPGVMKGLLKKNLASSKDVFHAESLWWFGRLINNSDMHLGNLSLSIDNDIFRLLPVYDMCSMGFAPKSSGEVPPFSFDPQDPDGIGLAEDQRKIVIEAAYEFWESVSMDSKISDQFRAYLQQGNPVEHLISNTSPELR